MNIDDIIKDPIDQIPIGKSEQKIHIRLKQRNARQSQTLVEEMPSDLDLKKITKAMRKTFSCMGSVCKTNDDKPYILFSGDQRDTVKKFLMDNGIAGENEIIRHGH